MSSTFTKIQNNVIEDERLNLQDLALYLAICKFANNKTQQCYPSKKSLLEVSRISDYSFRKSLNHLVEGGYVKVEKRLSADGKQLSNMYTLLNSTW
ncbi:helix-turn-helix domain-containing protein [Listeria seeligeri]|uniref:helix-turn-helix domain-containing protein n=1 Tax=Listeria seeligeri TaxID=1640 RepID=UPI0016266C6B|nr:helix-turn-helix domain-containing protein [Listeria seeligeri]MBC1851196.1 hypothetical protein [Listeria seeligeri]MBC6130546.1 hypothetical protein [Listeria seeligeri]MBF2370290.1 helix-turn-helix domain-containing protein [Listeria seeligeri]MBF2390490.1 helix-turn-helix domain-containing protein [Listeria seeligeri]